jgi:hypothetical protein
MKEKKEIWCVKIFPHENEIWSLSPSPTDKELFWTVHNNGKDVLNLFFKCF